MMFHLLITSIKGYILTIILKLLYGQKKLIATALDINRVVFIGRTFDEYQKF